MAWPVRSVVAGFAGTAALSAAYRAERFIRQARGPVDYDDSLVPGEIVVSILRLGPVSARDEEEIGLALRWSYGSVFGVLHGALRQGRVGPPLRSVRSVRSVRGEPWASVAFGGVLLSATFTLFPLLGRTPPPWRWPRGFVLSELFTHAVYVATVATVDAALSRE